MCGSTLSLSSIIAEMEQMQSELRTIGECRKANILDFAISWLKNNGVEKTAIDKKKQFYFLSYRSKQ